MYERIIAGLSCLGLLAACGDDPDVGPGPVGQGDYQATIRWTSHGVPHILAEDIGSIGFGLAYAGARDFVCTLADQVVKVRSERAKTFGPGEGDANIDSDFTYLALGVVDRAEAMLGRLSPDGRALLDGYVAGYNQYLADTGAQGLPEPCAGAAWVKAVSAVDLAAYYLHINMFSGSLQLLDYLSRAAPPKASGEDAGAPGEGAKAPGDRARSRDLELPDFTRLHLGSNAWAIGRDRAEGGRGMLVANPHFPWEGELRFHEAHLTIPGQLDVYGAALTGMPIINIGFNEHVAWTHTVSPANHFTVYRLSLDPGDPTAYVYEGETRAMERREHTIDVLGDDGSIAKVSRVMYRSHHGPMLGASVLGWSTKQAFALRDANEDNGLALDQWLGMDRARSLDELRRVHEETRGIPFVFTTAVDAEGQTLIMDASRVPQLSAEAVRAYEGALARDGLTGVLASSGIVLLDGSKERDEWVETQGAGALVPWGDIPSLSRTDFVMNANDTAWLANPAAPITGYSRLFGTPGSPISARTRMNLVLLTEQGEDGASGEDGLFSRDELKDAILSNRGMTAERLRAQVVERCDGAAPVDVEGEPVDVGGACDALAAWDGRVDLESVGALVWRELLGRFSAPDMTDAGKLYAQPFDPEDPIETPRDLVEPPAEGADPIMVALAQATLALAKAGLDPTTPLGEAQFTMKDKAIPIHGGTNREGVANVVLFSTASLNSTLLPRLNTGEIVSATTGLTTSGYPINFGTSFVMTVEHTSGGPRAEALLSYSQSTDPASPHFADQTELFSRKEWRPALFAQEEIAADPALAVKEVSGRR
ncbi:MULTISPECIES: acylase [Sorangium]|uniref:Peptidase S45 n=1 Tax=Sorangium cellulosum TaxID=56 RepID=A0A4P2R4M4_SORCE|nr:MULTISPECIES: acylase [Sorangium]AUX38030.1 peptidase S45 [Sorangium cellulosum]WCQ97318.1 Acyl-homoserine lactone acylase PvdQ [Sorangium sp. Soce836]